MILLKNIFSLFTRNKRQFVSYKENPIEYMNREFYKNNPTVKQYMDCHLDYMKKYSNNTEHWEKVYNYIDIKK